MHGKANSAKAKVKGKANVTEGKASSNFNKYSSKKLPQKHGGKKQWQGQDSKTHDSKRSHYQRSEGSPRGYSRGSDSRANSRGSEDSRRGNTGERGVTTNSTESRAGGNYSRDRSNSPEHRGERSGPPICNICDRPGHTADRCFSNPNCSSYRSGKSSAKAVTFNDDRDEESYYSANMIQVVLDGLNENLEEVDRRSEVQSNVLHHFAMTGHPVSLETDGFPIIG